MIITLLLTLLLVLTVLRHVAEPACPSCAAKRWKVEGDALTCMRCGWDVAAAPQPMPATEVAISQLPAGQYATAQ